MSKELKLFAIFDSKAQVFAPPFVSETLGTAERMFSELVNDPKTTVHSYPDDFIMYQVGTMDDYTGELRSVTPPVHLGIARTFLRTVV